MPILLSNFQQIFIVNDLIATTTQARFLVWTDLAKVLSTETIYKVKWMSSLFMKCQKFSLHSTKLLSVFRTVTLEKHTSIQKCFRYIPVFLSWHCGPILFLNPELLPFLFLIDVHVWKNWSGINLDIATRASASCMTLFVPIVWHNSLTSVLSKHYMGNSFVRT